jgi:Protein of unknown function
MHDPGAGLTISDDPIVAMTTMRHILLAAITALAATGLAPQLASAEQASTKGQPGLYATKAEAEAAAKRLNCTGAHAMGDQWMPCSTHPTAPGHGTPMSH